MKQKSLETALAFLLAASSWCQKGAAAEPPLRFFPTSAFDGDGDSIQSGVRVSRAEDGTVRVARERFESGGVPQGIAVPRALGGGFLFFQPVGSTVGAGTALFRAETWTGALRPLGLVPFVVTSVQPGFDRFYLLGAGRAIAVDPDGGTYLPLDPLPPVASILGLEFDDAGGALLRAPIVGQLQTADSGLDWAAFSADGGTRMPSHDDAMVSRLPRQARLVESTVLRGGTLPGGAVLALVQGTRVTFDPVRGAVSQASEPGLDPEARCQALPPGELLREGSEAALLWFACVTEATSLELRGYDQRRKGSRPPEEAPVTLARRESFAGGVNVLAAGRRGVLVDAPCAARTGAKGDRELCLLTRAGRQSISFSTVPGDGSTATETFAVGGASVHRVFLLPDGSIASQRLDAPGKRSIHRVHRETELEALVLGGRWLPSATVFEEGISFWAVRGESYVGVRLERGVEKARVGAIQRPLRRAFFSGSRALSWGASGFARVSVDSGMTFTEVDYPFISGDQDPSSIVSSQQELELGCGPAGCSLGTWLTVGWRKAEGDDVVPSPDRIAVPPLGGGRYRFICAPVGQISRPGLAPEDRLSGGDDTPASPQPAPPFWDRPAPRPEPLEVMHSVGDHRGIARLYARGPKDGPWGTRARSTIVFRSPFDVRAEFESLPESDLFVDSVDAQTRLGTLDRMTQAVQAELDPLGEAGVLLIRTRQQTTLFAFAHRAGIQRIDLPEGSGIGSLSGVVYSRGRFLLGHVSGEEFRIVILREGSAVPLAAFPLGDGGSRDVALTRTASGDLGIALDGDLGLLVYPVSDQGVLGDVLSQPFRGSRPPRCSASATGFFVTDELGISPYIEAFGEELDVGRVLLRRVVGFGPECIDAAAADARGALEPRLLRAAAAEPGGTPLVLTDRSETGQSALLSCH